MIMPFQVCSDYEDSDARNKIIDFSNELFSAILNFSIEIFMVEMKPVVAGKLELYHRHELK